MYYGIANQVQWKDTVVAEISNPNYNDQEERGTKKCLKVKLNSLQGEYGRKMTGRLLCVSSN